MATETTDLESNLDRPVKNDFTALKKQKAGKKKGAAKKKSASKKAAGKPNTRKGKAGPGGVGSNYPRYTLSRALRIPRAILDQNAGKQCTDAEAATFVGLANLHGEFRTEISSAIKYGILDRPSHGYIQPTELAKKIIRPQSEDDTLNGLREAVLNAPLISDVYKHYRGENIPDRPFFENALADNFKVPRDKTSEFITIFLDVLTDAKLLEKNGEKQRVLDISSERNAPNVDTGSEIRRLSKTASVSSSDTCFVMMPFAAPLGAYYSKIYEPAIQKAGLKPVRADDEIFGTGKIIDQIWAGINSAKVLIAELTSRNPNVFYELGLAHALRKPVVLVSANGEDVPFDLKHVRVIYYDKDDPFWGDKLIDKVAENLLSAISNPEEAILFK